MIKLIRVNEWSALLLLLGSLLIFSCSTDNDHNSLNDIDYQVLAEDATLTQSMSDDVFNVTDNESKNGDHASTIGKSAGILQFSSVVDTCAIVTLNTNGGNFPMTMEIDFGTGCTDAYQVLRKGKIGITFTGRYQDSGTIVTILPVNYYVNNYLVDVNKSIVNQGRNGNGDLTFEVSDQNGTITKPDGGIVSWTSSRTNTWTEGEGTSILQGLSGICDDVYEIDGTLDGLTSDGTSFRFETPSPLIKKVCCRWVSGGVLDVYVATVKLASIDYGNGTSCTPNANLSYGGNTIIILIQ